MVNMMKLMKQAADAQKNMKKTQDELAEKSVEFSSGGGMVSVTMRGDMSVERVQIKPEVIDPEDPEMLEDLVTAALDGALTKVQEMVQEEMAKVTAGLGLPPGMNLPI